MALDPRVVGDLVVGEEGRVDDGAPGQHVADHGGDLQVALDDRRPGAHQRVHARARDPRLHVVADLARRRAALADVVGERERRGAHDRVGAGEVGGVVAPERPAPAHQHGAHRQHRVRRVAGEDVRAAGAVLVQQPAAVGVAALELLRVARVVGDDRARRDPSPTSGRRACRRCRRAAAPPGRRRSARTSRSPSARAGGCPRAASAPARARCRRAARAAGPRGRGRRSRGRRRRGRREAIAPRAAGLAAHDVALPGLVVVDRQQRRRPPS